jgi:hypothetical protein
MRLRPVLLISAATMIFAPTVFAPATARADDEVDRGQARELGTKAYEAAAQGDWAKAEDLFRRADALYHAPTLTLGLARSRAHLGKYVEAWENYHRILIETLPANASPALKKAVEDARAEIGTVENKRAAATVNVAGATSPTVTIDSVPVPLAALGTERAVNPGTHALHVEAAGFEPYDGSFSVGEGGSVTQNVSLTPAKVAVAPAAPPPATMTSASSPVSGNGTDPGATRRTIGIVGMGVGGAGIVAGLVAGAVAMGQKSSLQNNACATGCSDPGAFSSYQSSRSSYETVGTIATVSFVAGAVIAAGGAVLFFTAPKRESGAAWISPYVGPLSAGAVGTF